MDDLTNSTEQIEQVPNEELQPSSPDWMKKIKYSRSFTAKLILSEKDVKARYAVLATELLSYEKVSSRSRWSGASFSCGRRPIAKLTFSGKTLCVYLAVDPAEFQTGKYKAKDCGETKKYAQTPARFRLRSDGSLRAALSAIAKAASEMGLVKRKDPLVPVTERDFPKESIRSLIARGLIKEITQKKVLVRTYREETTEPLPEATSDDAYQDSVLKTSALIARHDAFVKMTGLLEGEDFSATFNRKFLIDTIDESWVAAIEDTLPALDEVLRTPTHFIEENEELLPIERTKKVTIRSIQHLCQHTGLISRIENGVVIPSKLLNVFRDDSMMTYENKFLNTLLYRLYEFVGSRYEAAKEGANRKVTELTAEGKFTEGEEAFGKIKVTMELSEVNEDKGGKNYAYQTDLFKRAERIYEIVRDYQGSVFSIAMGNVFIRPPVMRTNAILKNKNMRQCLELWDFIESYEDQGGVVSDTEDIELTEDFINHIKGELCEQYLAFKQNADSRTVAFIKPAPKTKKSADKSVIGEKADKTKGKKEAAEDGELVGLGEMEGLNELEIIAKVALAADEIIDARTKEEREAAKAERARLIAEAEAQRAAEKSYSEPVVSAVDKNREQADERVTPLFERDEKGVTYEGDEEIVDEFFTDDFGKKFTRKVAYRRSLTAKLCLGEESLKEQYCTIYNDLIAKEGVTATVDFDRATFTSGEKVLARVTILGKTINLYLAVEPYSVDPKYAVRDASSDPVFDGTPTLFYVTDALTLKFAEELIARVCEGLNDAVAPTFVDTKDYPYAPIAALIEERQVFVREVTPYEAVPEEEPAKEEEEPEETTEKERQMILRETEKPADLSADYAVAALELLKKEKQVKGITVDMEGLASSTDIKKVIDSVDDEHQKQIREAAEAARAEAEAKAAAAKAKVDVSGAGGDALKVHQGEFSKLGGDKNPVVLELQKEEKPEEQKPVVTERPKTVPAGGDVLMPKPFTLEELDEVVSKEDRKKKKKHRR